MYGAKSKLSLALVLCAAANLSLRAPEIRFVNPAGNEVCDPITVSENVLREMQAYPGDRLVEPAQMERWFGEPPADLERGNRFTVVKDGPESVFISVVKRVPFYEHTITGVSYLEEEDRRFPAAPARLVLESEPKTMEELAQENPELVLRCVLASGYSLGLYHCSFGLYHGPLEIGVIVFGDQSLVDKASLREILESISPENKHLSLHLKATPCSPDRQTAFERRVVHTAFERRLGHGTSFTGRELAEMSIQKRLDILVKALKAAEDTVAEVTQAKAAATGGA